MILNRDILIQHLARQQLFFRFGEIGFGPRILSSGNTPGALFLWAEECFRFPAVQVSRAVVLGRELGSAGHALEAWDTPAAGGDICPL